MLGRLREFLVFGIEAVQFMIGKVLDINEAIRSPLHGGDDLVKFKLNRSHFFVLTVLNQEDDQERDDGRAGVDDKLPGIGEMKQRSSDDPNQNHT